MWDGIDCHRCRMLGWTAESVDDEAAALHAPAAHGLEPEGHLDRPRALGLRAVLHGDGAPLPDRELPPSACPNHPVLYGSVAMLWGYFSSAARGAAALRRSGVPALPAALPARSACSTASARRPEGSTRRRPPSGERPRPGPSRELGARFRRGWAIRDRAPGLPVRSPVTMESAIDHCLAWCRRAARAHTVITMNAAILCMMRRDPELRAACRGGDLIVADGMPVVWTLSPRRASPARARGRGRSDGAAFWGPAAARGLRVYFLGARPEVVEELARAILPP